MTHSLRAVRPRAMSVLIEADGALGVSGPRSCVADVLVVEAVGTDDPKA